MKKIECNPIISIIIPIYNVAEYIIECLESIYNQTYKNIEVILVDDCGSDNSMEIVRQYLTTKKKTITKIIQHPQNKGLSAARNTGIKHATGDYIYFIDSDDFITPNCIESFFNLIQKYNNPEIIFGSATFYPYQWGNFSLDTNKNELSEYCSNKKNINKYFFKKNYLPVTSWNKLAKKDFIIKHNLYFKEGIIYEDRLWYFLIAQHCKKIAFNKNTTYYYRINAKGIMHRYGIKEMNSEIIIIKEFIKNINYKYFLYQIIHIIHFSHTSYCRRYGNKPLPPSYIRYPKAFLFFLKCLFMKPELLRFI